MPIGTVSGGHEGKKIALHCKNQLTDKWSIQEIHEIFVTLVLARSRKYFFNSCPFFLSENWLSILVEDKKENSNFASFCTSSSQRSRVSRNVNYV